MQHFLTEPLMVLLNRLVQAGSPEHKNDLKAVQHAMAVHRRIGQAALFVLASWFCFSGAVLGLKIPPEAYKGWAGWGFLALAASLIVEIMLLVNKPGAYIWCTLYGAFAILPGIASIGFTLKHPSSQYLGNWLTFVWISAFIGSMLFVLIALVTAFKDPLPIHSIPARLLYLGRHGHLRALQRLAAQRGWSFQEPQGWYHAVLIQGYWRGRGVIIRSGVRFTTTGTDTAYYFFNVSMSARKTLWPFSLVTWPPKLNAKTRQSAVTGTYRTKSWRQQEFCLWPPAMQVVQPAQMIAMHNALEQGRPFLRGRTMLVSQSAQLIFERKAVVRLLENEHDIEQIIEWLGKIALTMENQGLSTELINPTGSNTGPSV
jgi:hypothetical protein